VAINVYQRHESIQLSLFPKWTALQRGLVALIFEALDAFLADGADVL
jgi:hypothetical protein